MGSQEGAGAVSRSRFTTQLPVSMLLQTSDWQSSPPLQPPWFWQQSEASSQPCKAANWQCMVSGSHRAANHKASN